MDPVFVDNGLTVAFYLLAFVLVAYMITIFNNNDKLQHVKAFVSLVSPGTMFLMAGFYSLIIALSFAFLQNWAMTIGIGGPSLFLLFSAAKILQAEEREEEAKKAAEKTKEETTVDKHMLEILAK